MGTKSSVISFDVEISEVAIMPGQIQEIFFLLAHILFLFALNVAGAQICLSTAYHRIHSDFILILL